MLTEYFLKTLFRTTKSSWQIPKMEYKNNINLLVWMLWLLPLVSSFSSVDTAILWVLVFLLMLYKLYHETLYIYAANVYKTTYLIHNHHGLNNV